MRAGRLRALFLLLVVDAACAGAPAQPTVLTKEASDAGAPSPAPEGSAPVDAAIATTSPDVVEVGDAAADAALPPAPTALRQRVALQANGAPILSHLPPGATFAALRASGDARASFGGGRGPQVDGLVVGTVGARITSAELDTAMTKFASGRRLVQVRDGKVTDFPPQFTSGKPWLQDFADAIGGAITTPELATIALWLQRYELTGATFDVDGDGFSFLVTSAGSDCTGGGRGQGTFQEVRQLLHLSRKGVLEERARTVVRTAHVECVPNMPLGRRPEGVVVGGDVSTPAAYFARAAKLEAVSVPAFERLARELEHHRADRALVDAAHRARRDEVRHAATMRMLAREAGADEGALVPPSIPAMPTRSIFAIALENAVEGCLLETYAALVATHQARHAASYRVRRKMDGVATDETRHAELAWAVDAWCRARLDADENRALDRARDAAIAELRADVAAAPLAPEELGEPDHATRRRLVDSMIAALS